MLEIKTITPENDLDKRFSILICSLPRRAELLARLLDKLKPQYEKHTDVEVLVAFDDGEATIGAKRNYLVEQSTGEYIAFVDDDDLVSDNYLDLIMKAIETNPDVVGIELSYYVNEFYRGRAFHTVKHDHWWHEIDPLHPDLHLFYRCPNHLNPVRRELAVQAPFPEVNFREDGVYSENLKCLLDIEVYIHEEPIYIYLYRENKPLHYPPLFPNTHEKEDNII